MTGYYVSNEGIHMGKKYPTLVRITPEGHLWKNMNPAYQRDQGVKKQTSTLGTFPAYPG